MNEREPHRKQTEKATVEKQVTNEDDKEDIIMSSSSNSFQNYLGRTCVTDDYLSSQLRYGDLCCITWW
ncbi:hypothetical protein L1987_23075 [Smallanthus sonchifolius]|uniref:Uncharacterized protein n=1 Tax=Smallanthus sonchifolius TaxID=185202 RepID=A0ACB9II37_9ASTR|nr:hypothetical protein L1987_23075 [Smallanthus sonchifolius]